MQDTQETWVRSLGQEDPLEEGRTTHSVFLPEKSHEKRRLMGYSLLGPIESGLKQGKICQAPMGTGR